MDLLDKFILLLSCIFEVYLFKDFFRAYFDYKGYNYLLQTKIIVSCFAVVGLFMINTYGNSLVNLVGALVIIWFFFVLLFDVEFGIRIIYFCIAFLVGFGCEFLYGILLSIPTYVQEGNSVVNLSDIPWHIFSMKLLTYILFSIIKQFFGCPKRVIDSTLFMYYLCIPIASLGIMLLTYYSGVGDSIYPMTKLLLCICFALMLFGNIFVFRAFNKYSEELYKNAEQKLIISRQMMDLQYYCQMQSLDDRHKTFIHDISHYLKTIGELAKENRNDNIISILQDLNIELENSVFTIFCSNPVVNSILSEKKSSAEKKGITLDIYVEPGVDFVKITDADLITILGNLLDNALRAAESVDNKFITIRIYSDVEGYFKVIKIKNYYKDSIFNNGSGFVSTKNEKGIHGVGIKSVEKTLKKYDGYLECIIDKNVFTAVVVLPVE